MDMKTRHPTLGSLLRGLRKRNGWTLAEMSGHTDIPVSTLSKVEHDRLTLTYDKLLQISQRLIIRMSELFADPATQADAAVTAVSVCVPGSANNSDMRTFSRWLICSSLS